MTLLSRHADEAGAAGGPVRVVMVIDLVRVSALLKNFTHAAIWIVLRRVEENKTRVEVTKARHSTTTKARQGKTMQGKTRLRQSKAGQGRTEQG